MAMNKSTSTAKKGKTDPLKEGEVLDFTKTKHPFNFNIESNVRGFKTSILNHLRYTLAHDTKIASKRDWWICTCMAVRDRIMERYIKTQGAHNRSNVKRTYFLSFEYLMGRLLSNNLFNTNLYETAIRALSEIGLDLDDLLDEEPDMGLGNGGLGRLAACFLDSLATLDYPSIGYGIYYEFGLFQQELVAGRQVEHPDSWSQYENPWQIVRPEYSQEVHHYGKIENQFDDFGNSKPVWVNTQTIIGIPWDIPICGYGSSTVNFLRLWESRASKEFDLGVFNEGGYVEAVREKALGETISKVLYPNDERESGKELRLVQQHFFVSCSLQDIIRRYLKKNEGWDNFTKKVSIHLNDTHPAVAVLELMRIFIDEKQLEWDSAWNICRQVFAYTNHTLLPEALEKWSVPLFEKVLPRHLQIIYEINRHFLEDEVEKCWPGNREIKREMSLIEEGKPKLIRMAYLSVISSHSVNGVAALHTDLLKSHLFPLFNELYPDKFNNKTNGITPRRWLKVCNPRLTRLVNKSIGEDWITNLDQLRKLEEYAENRDFQDEFRAIKHANKVDLAEVISDQCGLDVDPDAIFDVQVKRLHEYKRQHLNLLHILALYRRILHDPDYDMHPRVFIFAAKAAPGYTLAKIIIHAINAVGEKINQDTRVKGKIKVIFLPNYGVTLAEKIIPAADVSEQISLAGKEASGTGNMKLALNGAVTIGTLDGANVEIRKEVGEDNFFVFGMKVEEVEALRESGYNPYDIYFANDELRNVVDWIGSSHFTPEDPYALVPLRRSLLEEGDPFFVLADFESYCKTQAYIDEAYRDRQRWIRMAILNCARVGIFSTDRTIHQYAEEIWNLDSLSIDS